jgi:Cullin family
LSLTPIPTLCLCRNFYARKANSWIADDPTPAYLIKTEKAIEDEKLRISAYLNSETEAKVLRALEEEVLEKRESALLEKEVRRGETRRYETTARSDLTAVFITHITTELVCDLLSLMCDLN